MRTSLILIASYVFMLSSNAQFADAGSDTLLCQGPYTMQGSSVPPGGSGLWTLITGCGTIMDPTAPNTPITDLCPSLNEFVWTVYDGFTTTSDTVVIAVVDLPTIANAGPDQTIIAPPFSGQLMANTPTFPSYCTWTVVSGSASVADLNDPYSMVSGLNVGENIFQWTCFTGPCITSDVISINAFISTGVGSVSQTAGASLMVDPQDERISLITDAVVQATAIMDSQGRSVELHPAGSARMWDTAAYGSGVYLFRAQVNDEWCVFRFMVSR